MQQNENNDIIFDHIFPTFALFASSTILPHSCTASHSTPVNSGRSRDNHVTRREGGPTGSDAVWCEAVESSSDLAPPYVSCGKEHLAIDVRGRHSVTVHNYHLPHSQTTEKSIISLRARAKAKLGHTKRMRLHLEDFDL